jgi:uncharacterized membrane protein YfcA
MIGPKEGAMTAVDGIRLVTTSIHLSIVGSASTLGSSWILSGNVHGRALFWAMWFSILGAILAFPVARLVAARWPRAEIERRA